MIIPQSKLVEWQQIADAATEGPWIWGQGDQWEPVTAEEHWNGTDGDLPSVRSSYTPTIFCGGES